VTVLRHTTDILSNPQALAHGATGTLLLRGK
jgi:hypothetical protein